MLQARFARAAVSDFGRFAYCISVVMVVGWGGRCRFLRPGLPPAEPPATRGNQDAYALRAPRKSVARGGDRPHRHTPPRARPGWRHGGGRRRARVARDRPHHHGRPHCGHRGRRVRSVHLLRRRGDGRRVEDDQRRVDLRVDVRRAANAVGRGHNPRPLESERRVGRVGRAAEPAVLAMGDGRVPVDGRRPDLDPSRTRGDEPHLPHPGAPAESGRGVRGRDGPAVGLEPRARRVPDDGRRRDVGVGPARRRAHGGDRPRHGSSRSDDAVRGHVPAAAHAVGLQRRRAGQRHLPDDGRRRKLDEARRWPAGG